jgi:hypothetical protein
MIDDRKNIMLKVDPKLKAIIDHVSNVTGKTSYVLIVDAIKHALQIGLWMDKKDLELSLKDILCNAAKIIEEGIEDQKKIEAGVKTIDEDSKKLNVKTPQK